MEAWERKFIDDFVREGKLNNSGSKGIDDSLKAFANPILQAIKRAVGKVERNVVVTSCENLGIPVEKYIYVITNDGVIYGDYAVSAFSVLLWIGGEWVNLFNAESLIEEHNVSEDAHDDIRQIIADEVDERTDADTDLQQQIDAITSKSDVVAIVGTYEDLLALDTSAMFDNDIVKVLSDESRQGKKTYYYWDLANEAWVFVGSEAETYTKSQVDTLLAGKSSTWHTHAVKINGVTKTIPASGGTAIDLGSYDTNGTASSAVSTHNSSSSAHSSLLSAKAPNTPTFSQASTRANLIGSGETMATILGKIKKWFADLGTNSLAWISKNTSGSDSKVLSEKGNWVSLPSVPAVPTALSDLSDDSTHRLVTDTEKDNWNGKQDSLPSQTAYSQKGSSTKVARITTNALGQVTSISEVNIAFPSSSGMSADGSNAETSAVHNILYKATTSTNVGDSEYFVAVTSSGQWKYTMSNLKSYCRDGLAIDSDVVHKSGDETLTGSKTISKSSSSDSWWTANNTSTNESIRFGIGSGKNNRGIYDDKTIGGWLLRLSDDGKVLLGDTSSKTGSCYLKLQTQNDDSEVVNGIWLNNNPGNDSGDVQFGCFAHYDRKYGVQLDADRNNGKYGVFAFYSSSGEKWLCYMDSDGVAHLGKNTDAHVQLGNRVFDFSGTFGAASNTIYFI